MSKFADKIRILRKSKEWTQAQLADALSVSETTVQKWEKDKNIPPIPEALRIAEIFSIPVGALIDNQIDIPELYNNDQLPTEEPLTIEEFQDDTPHEIYGVGLIKGAMLHRFQNRAGVLYSAIYKGDYEIFSCERDHEQKMINYWNDL